MDKVLYGFNSSQDVINLQTKYALFSRVANIVFSLTVDAGFDKTVMTETLNKVIERNDCLRITFVKKGKETLQYFEDERKLKNIPSVKLETKSKMDAFFRKFRVKQANPMKGDVFVPVFATNPDGKDMLVCKISHFVADQYGIGVIVNDIFAVYDALKNGSELPEAPGSFEAVLKKDIEYKNNVEATEKDREFFVNYFTKVHPDHPMYCGIHGNGSDLWMKQKAKGKYSMPYLFITCDTEGYKFNIPAAVNEKVMRWCEDSKITMSVFYFYCMCIAASLVNDRARYQEPLFLVNNRGTLLERKAAGTKVQAISVFTTVDYEKSFLDNINEAYAEQNQLYRHTRLTYLDIQALEHKAWNFSMLSQINNFSYSFIPFDAPDGVTMTVHSNGKGALVAYIALMHNVRTNEIHVVYDIQTRMTTPAQLVDFQNTFVHVVEAVLADSNSKLSEIL